LTGEPVLQPINHLPESIHLRLVLLEVDVALQELQLPVREPEAERVALGFLLPSTSHEIDSSFLGWLTDIS
jgi:hypothetical protein